MIGILKESKKLSIQENLSPNIGSSSYGNGQQTRSCVICALRVLETVPGMGARALRMHILLSENAKKHFRKDFFKKP